MNTTNDKPERLSPAAGSVSEFPELHPVPAEIAVCPECGGQLHWQRDGVDDGDLMIDCAEEDWEDDDGIHRGWQSEWQPVLDRVTAWLSKLNSQFNQPELH